MRVLWNGVSPSLMMLGVVGKELPDNVKHCFDNNLKTLKG